MNPQVSAEALELGGLVRQRIEAEGGVDLLRRCASEPSGRDAIGRMLAELGIWELDASEGAVELEAAAEVCRAAGAFALPYPVVERLGRSGGAGATALIAREGLSVGMHLDLGLGWNALDLTGRVYEVAAADVPALRTQLAPFGSELKTSPGDELEPYRAAVLSTLNSWWLLGLLESAFEDTSNYTHEREQFGQQLVRFQSVAFQLAEMSLAVVSVGELAKYTLWALSSGSDPLDSLIESLALRVAAQQAADVVLRGAHQLHGAMGFTDEVNISWLSRASQGPRRLPEDRQRTLGLFTELVEARGYADFGRRPAVR